MEKNNLHTASFLTIFSCFQVQQIIQAIKSGKVSVETSLDLNLSKTTLKIEGQNVLLPDGQKLDLKHLYKIIKKDNKCFLIKNNEVIPIQEFSETTGWMRTLYPTVGAPTTLVSGIHMHRIKDIDPWESAKLMVKSLGKIKDAKILDTTIGLGYTAILAVEKGGEVMAMEIDPTAIELARKNPWSEKLFKNPKIKIKLGDIVREIREIKEGQFDAIIHDPPTMKLSGELYSAEFYQQLFRILKPGGKLFHYIGDPASQHGNTVTLGVMERLKNVGFKKNEKIPQAFGILAFK